VLNKRTGVNASMKNISLENFDSTLNLILPTNQNVEINKTIHVADNKKISQPYWLVYPLKGGTFDVRVQLMIGKAQNDPSFLASFFVTIDGEDFIIKRPVQYKVVDPVKGELYEPIPVLPKVELKFDKDNYVSINNRPVAATLNVKSNIDDVSANYTVEEKVFK